MLLLTTTVALGFTCGTLDHLDEIAAAPRPPVFLAAPGDELDLRDPFDAGPNLVTTEHFAIRWGGEVSFPLSTVEAVEQALEEIWIAEIEQMGWPQPLGTDRYRLNVYFGSTGGNTPEISFTGAYVTSDEEGYPYIVVSPNLLAAYAFGDTESVPGVLAHEFMHTIQSSVDSFVYLGRAGWLWEASAEWAVQRVYPDNGIIGSAVGAYTLLPHVSVDHFDYPDEGTLIESHHYGAEIFLAYLTELARDDAFLKETWLTSGPTDIPLDRFAEQLAEDGGSLEEAFLDFATRNVTFDDYAYGSEYAATTELYGDFFSSEDRRWAARVSRDGTDGYDAVRDKNLPWAWGYNHVLMLNPVGGELAVGVEADDLGSSGSPSTLGAALVVVRDDEVEVMPVLWEGSSNEISYTSDGDELYLVLVVAATPEAFEPEETFGYSFRMEWTERAFAEVASGGSDGPVSVTRACACSSGTAAGGWAALLLLPLLGLRRRR